MVSLRHTVLKAIILSHKPSNSLTPGYAVIVAIALVPCATKNFSSNNHPERARKVSQHGVPIVQYPCVYFFGLPWEESWESVH
jgi:hypothetical protein